MNEIKLKTENMAVSRISLEGWWLGNDIEHVVAGTALGKDYTLNIYTPSKAGMIGKFNIQSNKWKEIVDKSKIEFWNNTGQCFTLGVPDGVFPEWAVMIKPPTFNVKTQTVLYADNQWERFAILIGQSYWSRCGDVFIVSDLNFILPDGHTFTAPPEAKDNFAVRLVNNKWRQLEDYRGQTIHSDELKEEAICQTLGKLKKGWALGEYVQTLTREEIEKTAMRTAKSNGEMYGDYRIPFTTADANGVVQVKAGFDEYAITFTNIEFSNGVTLPMKAEDFFEFGKWFAQHRNAFFINADVLR